MRKFATICASHDGENLCISLPVFFDTFEEARVYAKQNIQKDLEMLNNPKFKLFDDFDPCIQDADGNFPIAMIIYNKETNWTLVKYQIAEVEIH